MDNISSLSMQKTKEENVLKKVIIFLSLVLVVYIIATKLLYPPEPFLDRIIYLFLSFLILFCFKLPNYRGIGRILLVLGTILAVIGLAHVLISVDRIYENYIVANEKTDFYFFLVYFIGVIILLHGTMGGKIISTMGIIAVVYLFLGRFFTGIFSFPAFSFRQIATFVFINYEQGAFGQIMSVTARMLSIFFIFSSLLVATGLGDFIRAISTLTAGSSKGGPAKVAVIASALFGMLSGSTVSNVAATGSFSIPLMKKIGYKPATAAAVETIASTGGGITPPIMGLSAFIMAEIVGISYLKVIEMAIIPAFLWYFSTFLYVHYSALAQDVQVWSPPRKELVEILKETFHLAIPIFVLIFSLIYLRVAEVAALYSVISLFLISSLRKRTRLNCIKTKSFLINFAKIFTSICVLNAMLGIFIGAIVSTGTHTKLISMILGGITNWWVLTIIIFVLCLMFGMLVPPFIAYITVVLIAVPALYEMGYLVPVIHMFVIYCCALAPITPPVALGAYTAAAIAGSDPIKTAKEATLKSLCLWLIPFMLFKREIYLGIGTSWVSIITWVSIMMIGIFIFTLGINKYCFGKISNRWVAAWLIVVGIIVMQPVSMELSILAIVLGIGSIVILYLRNRKNSSVDEQME